MSVINGLAASGAVVPFWLLHHADGRQPGHVLNASEIGCIVPMVNAVFGRKILIGVRCRVPT